MTAVVASSGGLMFGYDNGVTGGVTGMHHFLRRFFPTVRPNCSSTLRASPVSASLSSEEMLRNCMASHMHIDF